VAGNCAALVNIEIVTTEVFADGDILATWCRSGSTQRL